MFGLTWCDSQIYRTGVSHGIGVGHRYEHPVPIGVYSCGFANRPSTGTSFVITKKVRAPEINRDEMAYIQIPIQY